LERRLKDYAVTTPAERTRAVLLARELLERLASPAATPELPDSLRIEVRTVLRHYPMTSDLEHAALIEQDSLFGSVFDRPVPHRRTY
jgi:hypothetical protein